MNKRILAGILSLTMCASAISSGNAGLFAGAEGQNNKPSDSSPKETTDGNHSLPESSDITEEPEIPLKPVFHSIPDDTEIYESVSLGENISADVYSNGLLRIYGYGEMRNFNSSPFVNAAAITQILFEDTDASNGLYISNIGNNVFKGMYQLHASSYGDITKAESGVFVLPKNVTAVGSSAFANCSGLIKMIVPESVTSMDNSIFTGCTSLKELTIPFAATSKDVADGAGVGYYNSVSDLFVSPGWDQANNGADYSGYSIRKITVTGGDIIPDYAFSNMKTLEEVDFSSSKVSSVGNYAFNGCTALATVKLSKTVTSLGNYSFYGTSITTLPDNGHITSVGSYAFSDCINLSDITIPETYQTFGDCVFRNCTGITKLSLPSGTLSTGCEIFKGCTSLEELTLPFAATSKDVADGAGVGYYNSVSDLFVSPGWEQANNSADYSGYSIRKITVTGGDRIPDYAFSNMKTLEEVDFSSSKVSSVGNYAFNGCTALKSIKISDSLKTINQYAFLNCSEIKKFNLPNGLESIYNNAFQNCTGINGFSVPDTVTSMGCEIFKGCTSLEELTLPFAATSKDVADGAGVGYYNSVSDLFVSPGWDQANNGADYSGYSIRKITVTGGDIIPDYAFSNMKTLEEVDFSSSKVSSVGNYAFNGCTALATVKLSKTVTSLGNYSFCGTSITALPDNGHITSVGSYAFSDCINLSDITIPETYQTFGDGVFRNCTGITKLSLPSGTLSTGCEIFKGCTSLEELTLPFAATSKDVADGAGVGYYNSVSDLFVSPGWDQANNGADYSDYSIRKITVTGGDIIPDYAFSNMKTLEEVDFSSSKVSSVGNYAFNGCTALKSIKSSDSLKTINQYAFLNCSEIKKFNLPNGLETIYNNAFQNCTGINGFSVPDTVTSMGCEIFKGCTSLEELTLPFAATSKDVADGAGVGYYNSVSDLFVSPGWDQANNGADYSGYSIRKITVTGGARIPDYAFSNMKTLEEVTICNSDITQINPYAFNSCTSLKKIDIPENISSISSNAFANCNADIFVYNNSCTIADNTVSKDYSGTIHGFDGSTADDYADSHGYTFKAFDKELVKGTRNISMFPGDKYTVKSDYTDISFSSSDKTIASVNKNGVITALKPGNAVIEVKSGSDRSTGINVIVKTPVIETTTAVTTAESTTSQTTSATPAVTTVQETTAPAVTTVPDTVNSDTTTSAVTTTAKVTTVTSPAVTTTTSKTEVTTTTKTQTTTTSKPAETTTTTKISTTPAPAETTVPSASETSNTTKVTTVPPVVSSVSTTKTTTAASTAAVTEATTTTVTDPVPPEPRRLDIDGKMTVREMSYDDIQNSSIDISDPSNYHVYEYEMKATFDAEIIKIDKYVPKDPHGEGDELVCGVGVKIWIDSKPVTLIDYRVTATEEMYMFVRGECKWLKEFYDVELIVINKDDKNESLTDCYAKLNVPDGLTLANCEQEQKLDTLEAGEMLDVHWYVRGDKAGDYDLTSVFRGKNRGEEFTYNFKSQNTLHVYAENALKMEIRLPRYSFFDKDYPIEISFKNISDKPIYNIEQTINSYKQSTKLNVKKYLNGKLISEHTSYKTLQKGDLRQTYQLGELGPDEEFIAVVTIHDIWRSLLEQIVGDLKIGSDLAALITCCSANPDLQSVNLISSCYRHYLNSIEIAHVLKSVDLTPLPNSTVELLPNIVIIDNSDEVIRNIISRVACDGVSNGIYSALTTGCSSGGSSYTDYTLGGIGSGLATLGEDIYYRIYSPAGGANVIFYVLDANGSVKPAPKAGVNTLNGSVYDNFKIEVLDGEYSIDEKGNYVFETDASVKITPLKSGVKAIIGAESEDGTENISETIEVVDEHECKGEYTVLSGPDNEYGAFRLSLCETCGSLIDCAEMPKSATAMFDNGECYQDIRSALEDAAKSDEEAKLYIFGNVVIPEEVTVPENITLIIVPDTKITLTGEGRFTVKGEVKDFSGYDYDFSSGCLVIETASEETTTSAPETTASEETTTSVPEITASEDTTTSVPETTASEETTTLVPETTASEETTTSVPEITASEDTATSAPETTVSEEITTTVSETTTSEVSSNTEAAAADKITSAADAVKDLIKSAFSFLKSLFKAFFS